MNTLTGKDSEILQGQRKMPKQVYHQNWPQKLIGQIYCLLNSDVDIKEKISHILSVIGQAYSIDNVILLSIKSSMCQIYDTWGIKDQSWLETFVDREWFPLISCAKQHQVYQFCQQVDVVTKSGEISPLKKREDQAKFHYCILSIPLYVSQQFFGYLILQTHKSDRTFSQQEIETLEIVSHQISIAIQEIKFRDKLNQLELDNKRLQSSRENKSDHFSHISHELRTPLAGILGFSKMLNEEIYGPLNEKQKQYVSGIRVSGEHLLALVNDFLDLSKIEANKEELFLETIAVEDICRAAISIVQPKANEQEVELILRLSEQVDFCTVDQRKIKQILLNLLSNAIKFTEKGTVTLQVERTKKKLTFCVIDTGIGIKEEDQKKLFQPFQQINSTLSRKHKGTGLGLALSRKLAQLHEGDLTLTSEYGRGSCFTLELPINS
ncbi:MAG: GAF domain-containing sensor histidine kinase [Crocosphaera sp.]